MLLFKGKKVSEGIAIGPLFFLDKDKIEAPEHIIKNSEIEAEIEKLDNAVMACVHELERIKEIALKHLDDNHAQIIEGQKLVVSDQMVLEEVKDLVRTAKKNSALAYSEIFKKYENIIARSFSGYHQEREADILDIKKRMIHRLTSNESYFSDSINEPSIIVGRRISPADLLQLGHENIIGIITEIGGSDSHIAILAKAFRIPYITEVKDFTKLKKYDYAILDVSEESIHVDLRDDDLNYYKKREEEFLNNKKIQVHEIVSKTKDGQDFSIFLNLEFAEELQMLDINYIQGIGLFRSEFISIEQNKLPDEETQYNVYSKVTKMARGLPLIFRTFDFGRDKFIEMLDLNMFHQQEFEDWGGLQFCLENPDILKTQFRALLRASQFGPINIMLPMVSAIDEIDKAKQLLAEAQIELEEEGIDFRRDVELGSMIETKAVLEILDELAENVAFFSIGTNDLANFLLGTKREESDINNHYHPKLFQAIHKIIKVADAHGIPTTVCGEMGADRYALPGLIASGVRRVSVAPSSLSMVSNLIKNISVEDCIPLNRRIMNSRNSYMLLSILKDFYYYQLKTY
ncbi:MAG: phosphoenolpyruvate--protein phosphotransferase [Candidatus Marinimicrobia bacterium]|nr:phosphoenolpyruvate--protein phosphotransferase [Candidatus Neomarinimicrobiota bacterium]